MNNLSFIYLFKFNFFYLCHTKIAMKIIFFFLPLFLCERLFVFEHFRHGARNPCDHLDEANNDFLGIHHDVLGELTPVGVRMHYALGVRNRYRYKDFLSSSYDPREIHIVSTDVNRTVQSAISQLNGLYPFNTGPVISGEVISKAVPPNELSEDVVKELNQLGDFALPYKTQSIPIHLFHITDHSILLQEENGDCEYIKPFREKNMKKDVLKQNMIYFNNTYGEKIRKFLNVTKMDNPDTDYTSNFTFNNYICDHFIADYYDGKDLTRLRDVGIDFDKLEKDCQDLLALKLFEVVVSKDDPKVTQISNSATMKRIIGWMENRIALDKSGKRNTLAYDKPKFVMYSGHDTTVGSMEMFMYLAFKVDRLVNPTYAANLYLELHRGNDNEYYYVEYYMNDDLLITIPYNEFKRGIEDNTFTEDEIDSICNFKYVRRQSFTIYIIIIVVLSVLIVCLALGIIILYFKKKKGAETINSKFL